MLNAFVHNVDASFRGFVSIVFCFDFMFFILVVFVDRWWHKMMCTPWLKPRVNNESMGYWLYLFLKTALIYVLHKSQEYNRMRASVVAEARRLLTMEELWNTALFTTLIIGDALPKQCQNGPGNLREKFADYLKLHEV